MKSDWVSIYVNPFSTPHKITASSWGSGILKIRNPENQPPPPPQIPRRRISHRLCEGGRLLIAMKKYRAYANKEESCNLKWDIQDMPREDGVVRKWEVPGFKSVKLLTHVGGWVGGEIRNSIKNFSFPTSPGGSVFREWPCVCPLYRDGKYRFLRPKRRQK